MLTRGKKSQKNPKDVIIVTGTEETLKQIIYLLANYNVHQLDTKYINNGPKSILQLASKSLL